ESASAAKAAILSQVGQVYFGGWVSFTSALTSSLPAVSYFTALAVRPSGSVNVCTLPCASYVNAQVPVATEPVDSDAAASRPALS
ncbi:hypothetical protein, partial [Ralstonia pseudosolanacearum]|uniref:hypothetical protein n=1 Tax=Ralstonia pseudosolanacearum TaxID=1310165 RepID=UPI00399D5E98